MQFTILPYQVAVAVGRKIWRFGKLKKIEGVCSYLVNFGIILKKICSKDM